MTVKNSLCLKVIWPSIHQAALQLSQQQQSPLAKTQWTSYYLLITIARPGGTILPYSHSWETQKHTPGDHPLR